MAPPDPPRISIRSHHDAVDSRRRRRPKEKIVVVMGATGTGKSRLSVDLATRCIPSAEIINCDKIQLYRGLDITTNKIPLHDRRGVAHHLFGEFETELSAADYRAIASAAVNDVVSRRKAPLLVGGSNSFIHALLAHPFDPRSDPFSGPDPVSPPLRYTCCFLWVDVSIPVLNQYLSKRVDDMLRAGMFEELEDYFTTPASRSAAGINRAIGVPEFEPYFRKYPRRIEGGEDEDVGAGERIECYARAVKAIKENTCQLAKRQVGKIQRLREAGWDLKRLDATEAFRAAIANEAAAEEAWEKNVVEQSVKIVKHFFG
uniref:Adenylate isopentenyltransferase n=1 Tax=Kalanchoe fedtschenkoi TaxID=63787 RepID=A0A7N0U1N8_KALFE